MIWWRPDRCAILEKLRSGDYFGISESEVDEVTLLAFIDSHLRALDGLLAEVDFGRAVEDVYDRNGPLHQLDSPATRLKDAITAGVNDRIPAAQLLADLLGVVRQNPAFSLAGDVLGTLGQILDGVQTYEAGLRVFTALETRAVLQEYLDSRKARTCATPTDDNVEGVQEAFWKEIQNHYGRLLDRVSTGRGLPDAESLKGWLENSLVAYQLVKCDDPGTGVRQALGRVLAVQARGTSLPVPNAGSKPGGSSRIAVFGSYPPSAPAGAPLGEPIVVKVTDTNGDAVQQARVDFKVTAGGGIIADQSVLSEWLGLAHTQWTLGSTAALNEVTASLPEVPGARVVFRVMGTGQEAPAVVTPAGTSTQAPGWLVFSWWQEDSRILHGNVPLDDAWTRLPQGQPLGFVSASGSRTVRLRGVKPMPYTTQLAFDSSTLPEDGSTSIAWLLPVDDLTGVSFRLATENPRKDANERTWSVGSLANIRVVKIGPLAMELRVSSPLFSQPEKVLQATTIDLPLPDAGGLDPSDQLRNGELDLDGAWLVPRPVGAFYFDSEALGIVVLQSSGLECTNFRIVTIREVAITIEPPEGGALGFCQI